MSINFDRLNALAAEDVDLVRMLIDLFISEAADALQNMQEAASVGNVEHAQGNAHAMKGVCLNLGLTEQAEICKQMETCSAAEDFSGFTDHLVELCELHAQQTPELEAFKQTLTH